METTISDFYTSFYITAIQKLAFHLPHVRILGTNHCGELQRTAFKRRELFRIFLTDSDYDYILEEIGRRDNIEFEREVYVYSDDMED